MHNMFIKHICTYLAKFIHVLNRTLKVLLLFIFVVIYAHEFS